MKVHKKTFLWAVTAVLLAIFSVHTILSQTEDLSASELLDSFRRIAPVWTFAALLGVFFFIYFEGAAVRILLQRLGYSCSHPSAFLYSSADIYFSAVTPSASGGQPASAFFMHRTGIPMAVTTVVLMANMILFTLALLSVGVAAILIDPLILWKLRPLSILLIGIGYGVLLFLAAFFFLLLWKRSLLERILNRLFAVLSCLRLFRRKEHIEKKLQALMEQYSDCTERLKGQRRVWVECYFLNLFQRLSQIFISVFLYIGLNGEPEKLWRVFAAQGLSAIGSYSVPIPGGIGATDYLMLNAFSTIMTPKLAAQTALLSRGLSFYTCVILCGTVCLFGYFFGKAGKRI